MEFLALCLQPLVKKTSPPHLPYVVSKGRNILGFISGLIIALCIIIKSCFHIKDIKRI